MTGDGVGNGQVFDPQNLTINGMAQVTDDKARYDFTRLLKACGVDLTDPLKALEFLIKLIREQRDEIDRLRAELEKP